ncbi:MAG: UPF0175 family protein [Leptospiraceae bacterium]|nr:UPF0175 family protein [Leptospiraceae bacterium]
MKNIIEIECPTEILLGLLLDVEQFSKLIKREITFTLFGEGKISSGMGAKWLNFERIAMQVGEL